MKSQKENINQDIAIIGLAIRFPGARCMNEFWDKIKNGIISSTNLEIEEIEGSNEALLTNPDYMKTRALIEDIDLFEPELFQLDDDEAKLLDPQIRVFLECVWESFDNAGYNPQNFNGKIGVYAGTSINSYMLNNLLFNSEVLATKSHYDILASNDKDALSAQVSRCLGLKGPSVTVQTGSSTIMSSIHLACQSLLSEETSMCLAGGVSISVPQKSGYLYHDNGIFSKKGQLKVLDEDADGCIPSSGAGVVLLKRLKDAVEDNDNIYAVIKGSNIGYGLVNNSSIESIKAQENIIEEAYLRSGISADTISYVEMQGSGILENDIAEVNRISNIFHRYTDLKGFCPIGSVMPNTGNLFNASGMASLAKVIAMLQHKMLVPQANFELPHEELNINNAFYINTELTEWKSDRQEPLRAAINIMGDLGSNGHLILEEAPKVQQQDEIEGEKLILLSARTSTALGQMVKNILQFVMENPDTRISDIAYTTQLGRKAFPYRKSFLVETRQQLIDFLKKETKGEFVIESEETIDVNNYIRLEQLEALWNKGAVILWDKFYEGEIHNYKRLSLPIYPFERRSFWISSQKEHLGKGRIKPELSEEKATYVEVEQEETKRNYYKRPDLSTEYLAPRNEIEIELSRIWSICLAIDSVGINDNFIEIGGNSIIGTQILNRMKEKFPVDVPMSTLLKLPTIAKQAEKIEQMLIEIIEGLDDDEVNKLL